MCVVCKVCYVHCVCVSVCVCVRVGECSACRFDLARVDLVRVDLKGLNSFFFFPSLPSLSPLL